MYLGILVLIVIGYLVAWLSIKFGSTRIDKPQMSRTIHALGVLAIIVWTVGNMVTMVPAGHAGVKDLRGKVYEESLPAGLHFVNPLLNIHKMSVRLQELKETGTVPSSEGLNVQLDFSLWYYLDHNTAPRVYKEIGVDYASKIVEPLLRSELRGITSGYEAKALYTSDRELIAQRVYDLTSPIAQEKGIVIDKVMLRQVTLPTMVANAIEEKLSAEQESEKMKFVLLKETQEAERKRIEAKGISDFQKIVQQGLTEQLLRWKGIEATERLAKSQNAKVVIIGSGKEGLPIILSG
jgi:regulator of protease activity HflC (stomatin/prohibitin superfamily)